MSASEEPAAADPSGTPRPAAGREEHPQSPGEHPAPSGGRPAPSGEREPRPGATPPGSTPAPPPLSAGRPGSAAPWSDLDRPPLRAVALRRALVTGEGPWTSLEVVPLTGSTNADLVAAAQAGRAAPGAVLVAEEQSSGRGRLGRSWSAPPRSGIFFSVLLEPSVEPSRWGWLPLLAGVAAASALTRAAGVDTSLKWPNDLLVTVDGAERKCGGILAERTDLGSARRPAVVLGMGVNVSLTRDELPVDRAGSLALAGALTTDRDPLLRAVLRSLADWYGRWSAAGGDAGAAGVQDAYAAGCATLGRRVVAQLPGGGEHRGEAVALDGDGRLVIADAEGAARHAVDAADIVHLR